MIPPAGDEAELDRDRARKYGLSPQAVSQVLNIVVRAQQMRGFRTDKGEVEMWLRIDPIDMQRISDLKAITVGAAGDESFAEIRTMYEQDNRFHVPLDWGY